MQKNLLTSNQRRAFIKQSVIFSSGALLLPAYFSAPKRQKNVISCQQYTFYSFLSRETEEWKAEFIKSLPDFYAADLKGFEPSFDTAAQIEEWAHIFEKQAIFCRSAYVNSMLHERDMANQSIKTVTEMGRLAKENGIDIFVTNPSPIQWGNPIDKTDEQLKIQADALNRLGMELDRLGLKLAYHNHDMEMRQSAREFHHMMQESDPKYVHLCLDAHWIYRGAGNSQIALFDITKMYGNRVVELHLRQSQNGIWSEVFGTGDIDYPALFKLLKVNKLKPNLVLEQAAEEGTPKTRNVLQVLTESTKYIKEALLPLVEG